METGLDSLPDLVLLQVLSCLDVKSRFRMSRVCWRWKRLIDRSFELIKYTNLEVRAWKEFTLVDKHSFLRLDLYLRWGTAPEQWTWHDYILTRVRHNLIQLSLCWPSLERIIDDLNQYSTESCLFPRVTHFSIKQLGNFHEMPKYNNYMS